MPTPIHELYDHYPLCASLLVAALSATALYLDYRNIKQTDEVETPYLGCLLTPMWLWQFSEPANRAKSPRRFWFWVTLRILSMGAVFLWAIANSARLLSL